MSKAQRIEATREMKSAEQKAKLTAEFNHLNFELGKREGQAFHINKMVLKMSERMQEIWEEVDQIA